MKTENNKLAYIGITLIILLTVTAISVHAQVFNAPAVAQSLEEKLSSLFKIYEIEGYTTDENGNRIAVFNPDYEGIRTAIDFLAIFSILALVFLSNNNVKNLLTKKGSVILAFVLALAFLMGSKVFVGRIVVFWPYMIFIGAAVLIYYGLIGLFGGAEAGFAIKAGCFLGALALAFLLYSFLFIGSFNFNVPSWLGGSKSVGSTSSSALAQRITNKPGAVITEVIVYTCLDTPKNPMVVSSIKIDKTKLKNNQYDAGKGVIYYSTENEAKQKCVKGQDTPATSQAPVQPTVTGTGQQVQPTATGTGKPATQPTATGTGTTATKPTTGTAQPPAQPASNIPSPDSMISKLMKAGPADVKNICAEIAKYVDTASYKSAKKDYKDAYNELCGRFKFKKWQ